MLSNWDNSNWKKTLQTIGSRRFNKNWQKMFSCFCRKTAKQQRNKQTKKHRKHNIGIHRLLQHFPSWVQFLWASHNSVNCIAADQHPVWQHFLKLLFHLCVSWEELFKVDLGLFLQKKVFLVTARQRKALEEEGGHELIGPCMQLHFVQNVTHQKTNKQGDKLTNTNIRIEKHKQTSKQTKKHRWKKEKNNWQLALGPACNCT